MRPILCLSLLFCLCLSLIAAPVRADDSETKAVEAIAKLGDTITRDDTKAPPISTDLLTGKWRGKRDQTEIEISFEGRQAAWSVFQDIVANPLDPTLEGRNALHASGLKCVDNKDAGCVDILMTPKTGDMLLGRVHKAAGGAITLKIFPVNEYRSVEGIVRRPVPKPLMSKDLSGTWRGDMDGMKIEVAFFGTGEAHWSVNTGTANITAGLQRVDDKKTGAVQLRFDSVAKPTGTVLGFLERSEGETLKLTILPVAAEIAAEYKPVAGFPLSEVKAVEAVTKLGGQVKQDIDQLQGHWRVVSSQVADEKALEAEFKKRRITFTGDKLIYEHGNEQKEKKEGTIKLDPKTKAFDWILTSHGVTMLAIYELQGDDLKIGFGNDGLVRPRRFDIGKEDVVWLLVLKRNAKDKVPEDKVKAPEDETVEAIKKLVWLLVLKGSAFDKVPEGKFKAPEDKEKASEDKAVEAITALGGTITRDETAAGKPVIGVSFANTGITNEGLKYLKELKHLQSLNLHRSYRITDPALKEIAELKSLQSLDLGFTGLQTDTAINEGHLGESIFVTLVFRMGLGIPRRDCTGITNQGLTHLKQLENLQSLNLNSTQITDAGLAELKTLNNLQTLVIGYNEKMTGTGLAELKDLKNLQHLDLIHCGITDEGAKSLAELQSLKTIDLRGTQITDAGLKELQSLHNLKELNLCLVPGGPFDVTREGVNELQAALPEAKILR